jgi:hypothetical protein
VAVLRRSREKVFTSPPIQWIVERIRNLKELLERRTAHSAKALRDLLGTIRLEPVRPDIGRPFHRASRLRRPRSYRNALQDADGRFEFIA